MTLRLTLTHLCATMAIAALLSSLWGSWAMAQQKEPRAVAAPNFDLSIAGAKLDEDEKTIFSGTASLPVANDFGFQIDGSLASGEGDDRGGVAGHFFYRDPSSHLIGATAMWGRVGDYDVLRLGPEAEIYAGDTSFYIAGGWQHEDDGSTAYGTTRVSYYLNDNLAVGASAAAFSDVRSGGLDAEWQPQGSSFSVFTEVGDDNKTDGYALAGLRMSFGTNGASLKDKHRRYDPPNIVQTFTMRDSASIAPKAAAPAVCVPPPGCVCTGGTVSCI